jgi:hypothetical protein
LTTDRLTKALLGVIAACLVFLCVHTLGEPGTTVHGAAAAPPTLQFSADNDHFYFFDPSSQKVYTYPVVGGHTQAVVGFSVVGQELRPVGNY